MESVDVNVCLGARDAGRRAVTPETLLQVMDDYRITRAVAYHVRALYDPMRGNDGMKAAALQSGGRLGLSVVLDPALGAENLSGTGTLRERLGAFGAELVRVCPDNARTVFHPFYWAEILDAVSECALPLAIDSEYSEGFFRDFPQIAAQYPKIRFVLLRYGLCRSRHINPLLRAFRNVYVTMDTMLDNRQVEQAAEDGFAGQLLFASGYPAIAPSGPMGLAMYAGVTDAQREAILHGNWEAMHQ